MEAESAGASALLVGGYQLTTPQVKAAIKLLNVDPANARFMKLVDDMLRPESLPRGWTSEFLAADSKWVFKDKHGHLHDKHPVFDYYIGAMFMDKGGYARLKQLAAERPPTAEEIQQMGLYLKIKEGEDSYLWQVAEMALSAPLPPGWEEAVEGSADAPQVKFRNNETGISTDEHPLDNYFRELLRRRRKELLRRKKAALKALQALVRMGGARRGMLANLVAQKQAKDGAALGEGQVKGAAAEFDEEDADLDTMPPAVQSSLLTAWQGLVGSAVYMVKSMQAAHWDSSSCNTNSNSNSGSTGISGSPTAAAGARQPAGNSCSHLQLLCDRLLSALDPAASTDGDAAAALQDIEQLAEQAAAAGSNVDALAQVLAGQGIVITIGCAEDNSFSSSRDSQLGEVDNGRVKGITEAAAAVFSSKSNSPAAAASLQGEGLDAAAACVSFAASLADCEANEAGSDAQVVVCRSSLAQPHSGGYEARTTRKESTVGGKVSFLQVPHPRASIGTAGRLSLLFPSHGLGAVNNNSSSGAYMTHLAQFNSSSGAGDAWSLSGGAPTAAGIAAARNVRANAALLREVEGREEVAEHGGKDVAPSNVIPAVGGTFRRPGDDAVEPISGLLLQGNSDHCQDPNGHSSQPDQSHGGSEHSPGQQLIQTEPHPGQQGLHEDDGAWHFHGLNDLPPVAEAALQQMSALQAVIVEATRLIKSWQLQGVAIGLLSQRLTAALTEVQTGQVQLSNALSELDQIRQQQQQQANNNTAVASSMEYQNLQQKLESATNELERLKAGQMQCMQDSSQLQQALETAVAASTAATAQQQLLQEQVTDLKQQLQQELDARQEQQQQLHSSKAALDKLHVEHTQLQEALDSEAAATAAQLAQLQSAHQQLQEEHAELQASLADGQSAAATADAQQQQLVHQLQQELAALQAAHTQLQAQKQQQGHELADVQASYKYLQVEHGKQCDALTESRHLLQLQQQQSEGIDGELRAARLEVSRLLQDLEASKRQQQLLEQQTQQLQDQISNTGGELCNVSQQLTEMQQQKGQAQHRQEQLEQQKQQLQNEVSSQNRELQNVAEQLSQTQQHLIQVQQQQQQLEQQKQQLQGHVASLDRDLSNASLQLSQRQQQLAKAQQEQQQSQQRIQQLEAQHEKALEDEIKLMDVNTALNRDIKDLKVAAEAAEKQRLSKPSKVCQITAADAEQQFWTKSRSLQTGEELDPRSKRDVGTPADLALLSYFFREIKQKQRGGGGAIIGYDPESAREAAVVAGSPAAVDKSTKSWTGGPLPGIQLEGKRAASMPGGLARPHTSKTGGSLVSKKVPEEELKEGNLDLRPVPWEVKQRVDRRRDRDMRLENESGRGTGGDHDKWDYSHDERDNEIAELKKRLIEHERRSKDAATKAAEDLKLLASELQGSKRTAELLQSDNFTLRKEINSLRVAMQAVGMTQPPLPDSSTAGVAPRSSTVMRHSIMAGRPSVMSAPQGSANLSPAAVYAREGLAPRSSAYSRAWTTSSLTGSTSSTAGGGGCAGGLSVAGSVHMPSSSTAGGGFWGSGSGAGGIAPPAINLGLISAPGTAQIGAHVTDKVCFLSLSGASGGQGSVLHASQQPQEHALPVVDGMSGLPRAVSPPGVLLGGVAAARASPSPRGAAGQQLLPTIRSTGAKPG